MAETSAATSKRNHLACDRCHAIKVRCVESLYRCRRCRRLNLECEFSRSQAKRGKKSLSAQEARRALSFEHEYPVLDVLQKWTAEEGQDGPSLSPLYSKALGSRLLDHFFASPNQEFHTRIIRRCRLLDWHYPRPTSPALLLAILCMACYMPDGKDTPTAQLHAGELVSLRRSLLKLSVQLVDPVYADLEDLSFDTAVTTYMLVHIATSEDDTSQHVPRWLALLKFIGLQLNLNFEPAGFDEEGKEERRRLWWAIWIIDRHSSLSFNLRTQFTEVHCRGIHRPVPDVVWEGSEMLQPQIEPAAGTDYIVNSLDLFGIFVPFAAILGELLEYHFLQHHETFSQSFGFILEIRGQIEKKLEMWMASLQRQVSQYKSQHMYHCMYILLYGKMDFVAMYNDIAWLASPDFIKAGEHAMACGKMAAAILDADPQLHLCYRYFGTYLLQSVFLFLVLAKKLGAPKGSPILDNCRTNLRVLDVFVQTVNIQYQRTFGRALRMTISRTMERGRGTHQSLSAVAESKSASDDGRNCAAEEDLDPELSKYRWVGGYTGLWWEGMRPGESKKRVFHDHKQDLL